ncbi:MAG: ribbon-helix-helix protein, CopG family [Nitrososphaerales archaeon]
MSGIHCISIDEELWRAAKIKAARKGTSVSEMIRDALREQTGAGY